MISPAQQIQRAARVGSSDSLIDFMAGIPGVYEGIPAEEYHKLRAVSSTVLKRVYLESPKHAMAVMNDPSLIGSEEITIGGASHAMMLTPDEFERSYVCAGQCEETVKASGKRCENSGIKHADGHWVCGVHGKGMCHDLPGEVLTLDAYRRTKGIHDALWGNDAVRNLLTRATDYELTVLWVEESEQSCILCKARYDLLCRDIRVLPDLKTCRSAKPDFFIGQAWKMGYHLQLAHYQRGAIVSEIPADLTPIIAVENDDPFDVVVFEPTRKLLERGILARNEAITTLLMCEQYGVWPGYVPSVVKLDVPEWAA